MDTTTYPGGFLAGPARESAPNWGQIHGFELPLYVAPDVAFDVEQSNGTLVAVLGTAFNPYTGAGLGPGIAASLIQAAEKSDAAFWQAMGEISGRFVVFFQNADRFFVALDGAASKPVFHGRGYVGSHAHLLADTLGIEPSQDILRFVKSPHYQKGIWHLPGPITAFPGVNILTANSALDLRTGRPFRIPASPRIPESSVADIAESLQRSYALVRDKQQPIISLTGGIDSRMTFAAALADGRPFTCFTYVGSKSQRTDRDSAAALCKDFGVEHKTIDIVPATDEFLSRHERATGMIRNPAEANTIYSCALNLPPDSIEIKSSVSEIGRAFYQRRMLRPFGPDHTGMLTPREMTALYKNFLPGPMRSLSRKAFAEMPADAPEGEMNALDRFYWEHRLSVWQSLQLQDFELSHQTIPLFNNRRLMNMLLSMPLERRASDDLQLDIILKLWPKMPLLRPKLPSPRRRAMRTTLFHAMQIAP